MGLGFKHMRPAPTRRFGTWIALFAMLFQVLFGAAHAAALAASACGPLVISQTPNASFGLLQICTANGLISIVPADRRGDVPSKNTAEDRCHVCGSASVSPFLDAPAVAILMTGFVTVVNSPPQQTCALISSISRAHPIRAPPHI